MDVTELKHQPLGLVLADYFICSYCRFVDRDNKRITFGHPCSICKKPSKVGSFYFQPSVHLLINFMQEFFHANYTIKDDLGLFQLENTGNSKLGVVIFFTTLREVLLKQLLTELMRAQKIPDNICERLFLDNFSHKQRLDNLFPTLTGIKWKSAIKEINQNSEINYLKLDKFIEEVVKERNLFLHEGYDVAINVDTPKECIRQISPMLNLHVALHNSFVHPVFNKK
jgi:hypothetical protein